METTKSRYTLTDWTVGLVAFAVFGIVAIYLIQLTQPTGWTLYEWVLVLLCLAGTTQLALVALKRRRHR